MNAWRSLSIKNKLTLAIGGSLLLSIVFSTIISNSLMRSIAQSKIERNDLPQILSSIASQLELEIAIPLNTAKQMANNTFVNDWLANGEKESGRSDIQKYLDRVRNTSQSSFSFLVSAKTSNYYSADGLERTLSPDRERDQWFYQFLKSGQSYEMSLDIDESTGAYTLFINYLTNNKQAITGIGIKVAQLSELIRSYRIGESGKVFLIDNEGLIKVHSDSSLVGKQNIQNLNYQDLDLSQLLIKQGSNVIQVTQNEPLFMASKSFPSLNWHVIAEIPVQQVFEQVDETNQKVIVVNLFIAAIFLFFATFLARSMAQPIVRTSEMLDAISKGNADLSKTLAVESKDEIGQLAVAFNRFVEKMRDLVINMVNTAKEVEGTTRQVQVLAETTQNNTNDQMQSIDSVATAITEMGATVQEIAENASETAKASSSSADEAKDSQSVVESTLKNINVLNEDIQSAATVIETLAKDVGQIGSVLEVIRSISDQTNLLALNAAIEAARAGEQGRGFAVVADEVRTLASRTHESTEEISTMIDKLQHGASDAVKAMEVGIGRVADAVSGANSTGSSLTAITQSVQSISDMSIQVATATEEQSTVVEDLNQHIASINNKTTETADAARQTNESCDLLYESVTSLNSLVGSFKT
ncbi:methyl-accepting chemotaxis protein [Aliikangiella coralliicola]|uniref:Methyl-accepting chemotaxis protein n=1 Tax=Aliikangiella coralliicola TaxID=2592383 RepID=A0A545U7B0_9GAMM|nr:methyl-accepting chemotaxis protein [Aliikangiella coralliicola]TQV85356.1 methyl-accepting chemotaxis protein [Aliikangiella coralliicola]